MSEPFTTEIPVRYADIDTYCHVNNATYATYLEEARIDYLEALLGDGDLTTAVDDGRDDGNEGEGAGSDKSGDRTDTVGMVVANLEIDFRRSIQTADAVTVDVSLGDVGTSSFTLAYRIRSEEGIHADAETTMVAFDRETRDSRPLPEAWRQAIEEFEGMSAE